MATRKPRPKKIELYDIITLSRWVAEKCAIQDYHKVWRWLVGDGNINGTLASLYNLERVDMPDMYENYESDDHKKVIEFAAKHFSPDTRVHVWW